MRKRAVATRLSLALLCVVLLLLATSGSVFAKEKIESITDLPVRTYPTEILPSQMVQDPAAMQDLRAKVRTDVEDILGKYEIDDSAMMRRLYGTLASIALIESRNDQALEYLEKVRGYEEKEAARLLTGLSGGSLVAARAAGEPGSAAYREAFSKFYAAKLAAMPWDVVEDMVQAMKGRSEIISENFVYGLLQGAPDAFVTANGELNAEMAERVIAMELMLEDYLPLVDLQIDALQTIINANHVEKQDIWPARNVELDPDGGYSTVVVGIWDSGVDTNVFGAQMWTNAGETYNGLDDDGNGFVDDIHGIAYDMFGHRHPELLHPIGDQTGKVAEAMEFMKGMTDLQAAIDSPEATELKKYIGALAPADVQNFITALGFIGLYAHGTHVTGIATAGNPFAQPLCVRISFDYHSTPAPILQSAADAYAKAYAETARYFQQAGVRVVNMSWGWSFEEVENSLEANGIGESAEERQAMTEKIFGTLDTALHSAMASTPEILYCVAAGNDDSDVKFHRNIPSAYDLPNIMVVGAVDQAGERTSFTSVGENVVVYANGFEVESYVPGGDRIAMSGTSMASPNAANLAAKVFAEDPSLTPEQVIDFIEEGADELASQAGLKLIHPKNTLALVEKARASR